MLTIGRIILRSILAAVALAGVACAGAPVQEMSDARQAMQAARHADAQTLAPELLNEAQGQLDAAERALAEREYDAARQAAVAAKRNAMAARDAALENATGQRTND